MRQPRRSRAGALSIPRRQDRFRLVSLDVYLNHCRLPVLESLVEREKLNEVELGVVGARYAIHRVIIHREANGA